MMKKGLLALLCASVLMVTPACHWWNKDKQNGKKRGMMHKKGSDTKRTMKNGMDRDMGSKKY